MSGQQLQALQSLQAQQQQRSQAQPGQFRGVTQTNPLAQDLVAQMQMSSLGAFPQSVRDSPYTKPFAINTIPGYDWGAMSKTFGGGPTSQAGTASQQAIQQAVQQALRKQQAAPLQFNPQGRPGDFYTR
jgi:hypothetical protein